MKVVCIHNPHVVWNVTEGKIYDILKWNKLSFIIDDLGEEFLLEGNYQFFLPLEEYRQEQLDKLL
jgi:hypothetical protein